MVLIAPTFSGVIRRTAAERNLPAGARGRNRKLHSRVFLKRVHWPRPGCAPQPHKKNRRRRQGAAAEAGRGGRRRARRQRQGAPGRQGATAEAGRGGKGRARRRRQDAGAGRGGKDRARRRAQGAAAEAGRAARRRARRRDKGRQSVRKTTKKAGRNGLPCDFSLNSAHQSMRTGLKSTTSAETSRYATPSLSPWNARPRPPE